VGGAVAVWALESRYDIASAIEFELFIGDGGAGDLAAQLLQFFALIHGAAHLRMEAEPLFITSAFLKGRKQLSRTYIDTADHWPKSFRSKQNTR
jgi:hypothetical protein